MDLYCVTCQMILRGVDIAYCHHCHGGFTWEPTLSPGSRAPGSQANLVEVPPNIRYDGSLVCLHCRHSIVLGLTSCPTCARQVVNAVPVPQPSEPRALARNPELPSLPSIFQPRVAPVMEVYQGGRFGVESEVRIPAGDVAIMNDLLRLVELLHAMANRVNGFAGLDEKTRKLIRDMRVLATDVQDEVERRRGPTS